MGLSQSTNFESNSENDYNPFNLPALKLNSPTEFNGGIAMAGCPPFNKYTRKDFANLPIEQKAAYADGVVRGSYQEAWFAAQMQSLTADMLDHSNDSSIGGLAYYHLKTGNNECLNVLSQWCERHKNNTEKWI
jgi:hypothetical protein